MANKDYDELMQAFMNNSQKVYNEDKEALDKNSGKLPTSYSTFDNKSSNASKKKAAAKKNSPKSKPSDSPEKKKGSKVVLKVLLALLIIIAVVGIICCSVLFVYGYSVVHGDVVFNL